MNHYPHHIGDYRKWTSHLSNDEDLAYRRLLDMYYDSEGPIPLETEWVSRRLRIGTDVVLSVLKDFFRETPDGWRHDRCDEEIDRYRTQAATARENGRKGGRPRAENKPSGFQAKPTGNPVGSNLDPSGIPVETGLKANQNQNQNQNQEPEEKSSRDPLAGHQPAADLPIVGSARRQPVPVQAVIDLYAELLPGLPQWTTVNAARKAMVAARWRDVMSMPGADDTIDGGLFWFRRFFSKVADSQFLTGRSQPGRDRMPFVANLDWLLKPANFAKVADGVYQDRQSATTGDNWVEQMMGGPSMTLDVGITEKVDA